MEIIISTATHAYYASPSMYLEDDLPQGNQYNPCIPSLSRYFKGNRLYLKPVPKH